MIIKIASGKSTLEVSFKEWYSVGVSMGWTSTAEGEALIEQGSISDRIYAAAFLFDKITENIGQHGVTDNDLRLLSRAKSEVKKLLRPMLSADDSSRPMQESVKFQRAWTRLNTLCSGVSSESNAKETAEDAYRLCIALAQILSASKVEIGSYR